MTKQELYDQIIWDVARIVKHRINECCGTSRKSVNEDYINDIDDDDLIQDFDFVKDDIVTALKHIMNGEPNPYDIDPWKYVELYHYPIYQPDSSDELKDLIRLSIEKLGPKCSHNWIDVSYITDFSSFFYYSKFNGDISGWSTSHATNMSSMFAHSKFNGDISSWNTYRVKDMHGMFFKSKFNQDISEWNTSNVENMS